MNKIIVIFGLILIFIASVAIYQFSKNQLSQLKPNGKVTFGKQTFNVETVKDSKAQQVGLTKYNSIKTDQGMLFVFDKPDTYSFWMKNMKFPIDIIFIKDNSVVSFVENAKPVGADAANPPIYTPTDPADKVVEIQAGLVKKYAIKKGDTVKIETK